MPDDPTDVLPDPNNPDQFPPAHWDMSDPTVFGLPSSLVENATGPAVSASDPMPPEQPPPLADTQFPPAHWYSTSGPQTLGEPTIDKPIPTDEHGNVVGVAAPIPDVYGTGAPNPIGGPLPSDIDAANAAEEALADRKQRDEARGEANLSPQELALRKAQADKAIADENARRQAEASHASLQQSINNLQDLRTSQLLAQADSDRLDQDAKIIANTKIDPDHWRDSRTVGQSIAGFIAAVAGGMNSANTGGRNLGLDAMQKHIDDDVAAQTANLANQWKGIGEQRTSIDKTGARAGDLYRAQETLRLANWEDAKNQIATEMTKYDPKGATALGYAQSMQQITAMQEQIKIKAAAEFQKQRLEDEKATREKQLAENTILHDKRADATAAETAWTGARGQNLRDREYAQQNTPIPVDTLKQMYPGLSAYPEIPTSRADMEKFAGMHVANAGVTDKAAEKADKDAARVVMNPVTGKPIMVAATDANGKTIMLTDPVTGTSVPKMVPKVAGDSATAEKVNESLGAAQDFMDATSRAIRLLKTDPSLVDRSQWATISTDIEAAKIAYLGSQDAKLSTRTMEAVQKAFGGNFDDLTDRLVNRKVNEAKLREMMTILQQQTKTKLKAIPGGYEGKEPLLDTSNDAEATDSPTDTLKAALLREQSEKPTVGNMIIAPLTGGEGPIARLKAMSPIDEIYYAYDSRVGGGALRDKAVELADKAAKKGDTRLKDAIDLGMRPSTVEAFQRLEARYQNKDTSADAGEALRDAAEKAPDESVRKYAEKILMRHGAKTQSPAPEFTSEYNEDDTLKPYSAEDLTSKGPK